MSRSKEERIRASMLGVRVGLHNLSKALANGYEIMTPSSKLRTMIWALMLLFACSNIAPVVAQQAAPLQGSIQKYAADSAPIDPLLYPGNNFDKDAARSLLRIPDQETSIWKRIPEWQVGNWEEKQAVNIRAIKFIDGNAIECQPIGVHTAEGMFLKGLLKDNVGAVWHWFQSDYWAETDQGDKKVFSYVLNSSPGGGEFPDFYAESVDFAVDKASAQILSLRRAKVYTRYTNLSPGIIKEETLRTNFDTQGHATSASVNTAISKRTKTFSTYESTFASQKPMVASFHSFLRQHNMANLIPVENPKPHLVPKR